MSTVLGIECAGGTVLAGDRTRAEGGTVTSKRVRHVFDFGDAGVAAVGNDVDAFARQLESELDAYRTERDEEIRIDPLERIAADVLGDVSRLDGAIVSARDEDGRARLREIGPRGEATPQERVAVGSGAQLAYGQLEAADLDVGLDAAASLARDILATVAERDGGTGGEIDLWRLEHAEK